MDYAFIKQMAIYFVVGLALVSTQAFGDEDNGKSTQFDIDEVFVAGAYIDGGSFVITASTTDSRTIYIFIDKSSQINEVGETEIAFINAENLANSPDTMRLVLNAIDTRFRSHFSGKSANELLEKILDDSASLKDRNVFSLVFLLEEACAKNVFKDLQPEITESIDCDFYLNNLEK